MKSLVIAEKPSVGRDTASSPTARRKATEAWKERTM